VIAFHWQRAGNAERERHHRRIAGEVAAQQYLNAEALTHLSRALELTADSDLAARYETLRTRAGVYHLLGERAPQKADLDALADLASRLDDPRRTISAAILLSNYHTLVGEYEPARAHAQRAIARAAGEEDLQAEARLALAAIHRFQDEHALSEQEASAALAVFLRLEDASQIAAAHEALGDSFFYRGDFTAARRHWLATLDIYGQLGNRRGTADAYSGLGIADSMEGAYAAALENHRQALALRRTIGDRTREAITLSNMGIVYGLWGDLEEEKKHFEQALAIAVETNDPHAEAGYLHNLAGAYASLGEYARAIELHQQSLAIGRELGSPSLEAGNLSLMGSYLHALGDHAAAEANLRQGLAMHRAIGDRDSEGDALIHLGFCLLDQGRLDEAEACFREDIPLRAQMRQPHRLPEDYAGLARIALRRGDLPAALGWAQEILAYLPQNPELHGGEAVEKVFLSAHEVLLAGGRVEEARRVAGQAYDMLMRRAAKITDAQLRRSMLDIAEHRAIVAAYAQHH
jgi:tetratricopeptide (TPR) repeat protein